MVEWKKLGDVCKILNGYSFKSNEYVPNGVRVIRISDVQSGHISDSDKVFYPKEKQVEYERFLLKNGDLVMSLTGNPGRVAFIKQNHIPCALNQRVACLRVTNVNRSYLFYLFNCKEFESIAYSNSTGGAQKNLSTTWLSNYKIPVPSIAEQTRIVGILDTFTAAIDNLKQQIEQRRKQYEYYRDNLLDLEGKEGVEMRMLGECGDVTKLAGFEFTEHVKYKVSGQIIALRGLNVRNGHLDLNQVKYIDGSNFSKLSRSKLRINDMLFTYVGTIGNVALIDEDDKFYLAPNVSRIRFDNNIIISKFALYVFMSQYFYRTQISKFLNSSSMKNLSMENIRRFKLPIPSLTEQHRIATILDTFEDSIRNLEEQLKLREKQYEYYRNKLLTFG